MIAPVQLACLNKLQSPLHPRVYHMGSLAIKSAASVLLCRVALATEAGESRVCVGSGNVANEIGLIVVQADYFAASPEGEQRRASVS